MFRMAIICFITSLTLLNCKRETAVEVNEDPWEKAWIGDWKVLYTYQGHGTSGPKFTSTGGLASEVLYSYQNGNSSKIVSNRILDSQCMCLKWVTTSTQGNMMVKARSKVENSKWKLTEYFTFTDITGIKDEWEDYIEFGFTEKVYYYNPIYRTIEVNGDILKYSLTYFNGGSSGGYWLERKGTLIKMK